MTPAEDRSFNTADIFRLFSKYRWLVITGSVFFMALFGAAAQLLPPKYKSHFVLSIYAKYFQSPLIRDFIPEIGEGPEMRLQREALIRQVLTPEFIDSLGVKYGIYADAQKPPVFPPLVREVIASLKALKAMLGLSKPVVNLTPQAAQRDQLLSHLEMFDINSTTYQVGFVYSDPQVAFGVTQDIYNQVLQTLPQVRLNNLTNIRDAIRKRLETLGFNMSSSSAPDPRGANRPQVVRQQLADVRDQIRALSSQYTEDHPRIKELRNREQILLHWSHGSSGGDEQPSERSTQQVGDASQEGAREMYNDLNRKLIYLNIAIDSDKGQQGDYFATLESPLFPTAPISPKKALFILYGLVVGLFGTVFIAGVREYFDRAALKSDDVAHQLGIPLLGKVPAIHWRKSLPKASKPE